MRHCGHFILLAKMLVVLRDFLESSTSLSCLADNQERRKNIIIYGPNIERPVDNKKDRIEAIVSEKEEDRQTVVRSID